MADGSGVDGQLDQPSQHGGVISLKDRAAWAAALNGACPVLAHLNADTTWLLQLPIPTALSSASDVKLDSKCNSRPRSRYNILIDPWLQGPQSDVASWFSTQWHVVAPAVQTIQELDSILAELEDGHAGGVGIDQTTYIDCVAISHEFTDHCHEATLRELPKRVPVIATDKAAALIRSWKHFDTIIETPGFSADAKADWQRALVDPNERIPPWVGIGRVITQNNALYYHSAIMVVFDRNYSPGQQTTRQKQEPQAVIYSPHGIKGSDLECIPAAGIKTLALLHGLHDVRIWMTKQLNLGALNGIQAVRACGAKYWVATHDEAKKGGGFISWLLRRKTHTLEDAAEAEKAKQEEQGGTSYEFVELRSGDGLVLS
ncbi:hypothetical protein BD289DRAFT_434839 [Coniella lustricola]|uniref:Uncharacterized protein n=1 Tax=Coniella lustricola TaxID=2025994 RepID=A0A2T3A735_9PEZI|nr:hypothetical protein BD289DRAFT_434839 [Coniella lustricola]